MNVVAKVFNRTPIPRVIRGVGGAGGIQSINEVNVLRFLGQPEAQHVRHGYFWPPGGTDLGTKFYWDAWVKPFSAGYLVSDGYGGSHALLWGFGSPGSPMTGNVWTGAASTTFGATYPIAAYEWVHAAVAWDGTNIYHFINGICDGRTAFAGPRQSVGEGSGGRMLYIGGSDHSNMGGDVAAVRAWDRNAHIFDANQIDASFIPERHFSGRSRNAVACDFLCDYTEKSLNDRSPRGVSNSASATAYEFHNGVLFNARLATDPDGPYMARQADPLPRWIRDGSCPYRQNVGSALPEETIPSPAAVPAGALVFDSFGRRNQTSAFQYPPSLGSTEGGSAGVKVWSTGIKTGYTAARPGIWGILGGKAVYLEIAPGVAWVETGTANQDVRITRSISAFDNKETGIAFSVVDKDNHWQACFGTPLGGIRVGYWTAGAFTPIVTTNPGSTTWTKMRVWRNGSTIRVYVDDGAGGWTQIGGDITNANHSAATKAGLACPDISGTWNSLARYDDFTVLSSV